MVKVTLGIRLAILQFDGRPNVPMKGLYLGTKNKNAPANRSAQSQFLIVHFKSYTANIS